MTKRKKFLFVTAAISILVILAAMLLSSCKFTTIDKFEETRELMGTYVTITVYSDQGTAEKAISGAYEKIEEVVEAASVYDENSETSLLNKNGYIDNPSPMLVELVRESIKYYEITGGSFDITIRPVLLLWSGGLWEESEEVQKQKVAEALELVGSDMISVSDERIEFKKEGMEIDLGGIAKGYAVDKALEVLREAGIKYALINAGGDLATIGSKPDGSKWHIALDNPDDPGNAGGEADALPSFEFASQAVATSGNYYRYYDPEKEVHHISDPATGYSANSCISATVIADTCTVADILATAVFVKGPEKGMDLVESLDEVEALIIDSERNLFESSGLSGYMIK